MCLGISIQGLQGTGNILCLNLYGEIWKLVLLFFVPYMLYIFVFMNKYIIKTNFEKDSTIRHWWLLDLILATHNFFVCHTLSKFRNFCCSLEGWSKDINQACKTYNHYFSVTVSQSLQKHPQSSPYSLGHPSIPTGWCLTELSTVLRMRTFLEDHSHHSEPLTFCQVLRFPPSVSSDITLCG